jgi:hypothetical protein
MTMLVVALPWTTALSINLRCATPLLPIAIDRPSPPLHRPLPNEAVNAPQQQTASAEIPIASDAPPRHISRGFLPWRFADAGPAARGTVIMGRHPKTFTFSDVADLADDVRSGYFRSSPLSRHAKRPPASANLRTNGHSRNGVALLTP